MGSFKNPGYISSWNWWYVFICCSHMLLISQQIFLWRPQIQQYNQLHSLFWNYLENIRASLQNKTYSQPVVCRACTHNTKHTRLLTLFQCRYNIFTPPLPSVLCLAHARTGIGKAIVSNCHAQDFDYTLALKAQDCKRTIAQRALSSRRCNFNPFLMREHTKR